MARKLPGLERVLGARALGAIAYGELISSVYLMLGLVVSVALDVAPLVVFAAVLLVGLVSVSYARAVARVPDLGGGAALVRRVFGDVPGFVAGWTVLFAHLVVASLAALFVAHYAATTFGVERLRESPTDAVVGGFVIGVIAVVRLLRRTRFHRTLLLFVALDVVVLVCLVGLGAVFAVDGAAIGAAVEVGGIGWRDLVLGLGFALLAFSGVETLASHSREAHDPAHDVPRALGASIAVVGTLATLLALVSASLLHGRIVDGDWLEAPVAGLATELGASHVGGIPGDAVRVIVGLSGVLVLIGTVTTALGACARLLHSMAEHGMLPTELGRLEQKTLFSQRAILSVAFGAVGALAAIAAVADGVRTAATGFAFALLVAFTLAQAAAARMGVGTRAVSVMGSLVTGVLALALGIVEPRAVAVTVVWLAAGLVVYAATRHAARRGLFDDIDPIAELPRTSAIRRILVPVKLGNVGEEVAATAVALARDSGAVVDAVHVVRVPRRYPLDGPLPAGIATRAEEAFAEARLLGEEQGVVVETSLERGRAIGPVIVEVAERTSADLIVLGSAPRWRRQSRFFSPTVDYVLDAAPCEVLVVAYPGGMFETAEGDGE